MTGDPPPHDLLADMLRAARRGEPWVITLIALLTLTVVLTALLLATSTEPAPTPSTRPTETR